MTRKINLQSNTYICEKDNNNLNIIYEMLNPGSKTLVLAPMKAGKTHLANELFKMKGGSIKVFLTPRNSLGYEVQQRFREDHNVKMLFEGDNISSSELKDLIITSPESFIKKVIPLVKTLNINKEIFVIYDEIHLAISDLYRQDLYDVININEELKDFNTEFTLLGLTATEGQLKEFVRFDSIIMVNIKNSFKQTDIMAIVQIKKKVDEIFVASTILKTLEENPKSKITIRLNDKDLICKTANIIKSKLGVDPLIATRDTQEEVKEIIENNGRIEQLISFFTSYTEVGVEFTNTKNMILLDFEGLNNSNINPASVVQNIGRYRDGLKAIIVYVGLNKTSLKPNIKQMIKARRIFIKSIIETSIKARQPLSTYTKFSENGFDIEIASNIEFQIMKYVMEVYNTNLVRNAKDLKKELSKIKTLNINNVKIVKVNYDKIINYLSDYKEIAKQEKKILSDKKRKWKSELDDLIINSTDKDFKNFHMKEQVFSPAGKRMIELLEYLGKYKEVVRCYNDIITNLTGLTPKEYALLSLDYKTTTKQITAITNNIQRDTNKKKKVYSKRDNESEAYSIQNHIMNVIEATAGNEKQPRLTKKLMDKILEECQYKDIKGTKKDPYKELVKVLGTYYTLSPNGNGFKISSIKKSYKRKYFKSF